MIHKFIELRPTTELTKHVSQDITISLRLSINHKDINYIIDPCVYSSKKEIIQFTILNHTELSDDIYDGIQAILRSILLMTKQCNIS